MPISDGHGRTALAILACAALGGCGQADPDALLPGQERIACAMAGRAAMDDRCSLERARDAAGPVWTIGHATAGYRRIRPTTDGRGLVTADGSEPARVTIIDASTIEVAIGPDRYRLPATLADAPASSPQPAR